MSEPVVGETRTDDAVVADYMARLAAHAPTERPSLPDADLLWVKARLLQRWEAERRVQAPLEAIEPMQFAAGLAAAFALLIWSLPSLLSALSRFAG